MFNIRTTTRRGAVALVTAVLAVAATVGVGQAQTMERHSLLQEIRDKGELRVGYAPADPHAIKDPNTGQWSGIAYDIMDNLAQALQVKHVAVDTTFADMIAGLTPANSTLALPSTGAPLAAS